MTIKEKEIPNLINSPDYLKGIFNERIKDINPKAVKVLHMDSYPVKEHLDENFFHYVILNNVAVEIENGLRRRYKILAISFSGHGRKRMYQALKLVYENGFNQGEIIVPRPLWYIDSLMAAFYVGIPGDNLLEHIKYNYINLNTVAKIAKAILKLHNIKSYKIKLSKHKFSLDYLDPTNVLKFKHNLNTKMSREVMRQFKTLKAMHKKIIGDKYLLSHGDFHPENVIINQFNNRQVAIIDFSEVCQAPIYYDIASFLQQLEFMSRSYITLKEYGKIENAFLASYFNELEISQQIKNKINLYKAWTALKSTVYFMIFEDEMNRNFAKYLLKQSENFSQLIYDT